MLIETLYLTIIISILGLIIATYTDLKERIVPNKLNYGLAALGLLIYAVDSIIEAKIEPLAFSIIGLAFGFLFGWILWKLGVFAGGDVKLFMALGALNPFTPALLNLGLLKAAGLPIFPITLFVSSLISFLPYGVAIMVYKVSKNKKIQKQLFAEMKPKTVEAIHTAIFASAEYTVLAAHINNSLLIAILILVSLAVWELFRKNKKFLTLILSIGAIVLNTLLFANALLVAAIASVGAYLIIKIMLSTRSVFTTQIKVKDLEEGMIPAKSLVWKGRKVGEEEGINLKQIIKYAKQQNTSAIKQMIAPQREIISARKARGLTGKELREVKKLAVQGLIQKTIAIKESMPFVPTMLLGYLLCLAIGDAVLFTIFKVF